MPNRTPPEISEEDLSIFPPHLLFFILASLSLMISHGLAATIVFFIYLPIPPGFAFGITIASSMIFVVLNVLLIRGWQKAPKWLALLAGFYLCIAASSFIDTSLGSVDVRLSWTVLISSLIAWLTIKSPQYQKMASFMVRRWQFYRETGRTVVEELNRQKRMQK